MWNIGGGMTTVRGRCHWWHSSLEAAMDDSFNSVGSFSSVSKVDAQRRQVTLGGSGGAFKCTGTGPMLEGDRLEVASAADPFGAFGSFTLLSQAETPCGSCKCTTVTAAGPLPDEIAVGDVVSDVSATPFEVHIKNVAWEGTGPTHS